MANTTNGQNGAAKPQPQQPKNLAQFEEIFRAFAKFGDSKSIGKLTAKQQHPVECHSVLIVLMHEMIIHTGETITLSNSDKWMKQAKVIDPKKITTTDTGIAFKKIAK